MKKNLPLVDIGERHDKRSGTFTSHMEVFPGKLTLGPILGVAWCSLELFDMVSSTLLKILRGAQVFLA